MPYNGSGTFNRVYSWTTDAANGIKIRADRMDTEDNGFATGLTDCVTRDGQSAATADLPMGGYKHTNIAPATATSHYAAASQIIGETLVYTTAGGTADAITLSSSVAPASLAAGQRVVFIASGSNTGAVTINRDSLGAKALQSIGAALPANALATGDIVVAIYDGTQYQLTWPLRALSATNLLSGTIPDARFPATLPASSGANLTALNATQLAAGTIPDARFPATLPTANGSNLTNLNGSTITTGTVPKERLGDLPAPTSTTFGGVKSLASVANKFLTSIGTDGVPVAAQPSAANISGLGSMATAARTISTSSPSGTPADGDVWVKYTP